MAATRKDLFHLPKPDIVASLRTTAWRNEKEV